MKVSIQISLQHVWVLRILIQLHPIDLRTLHNLVFLVSADSMDHSDLAFYDFIRRRQGAYSPTLQQILKELHDNRLISLDQLSVSESGRELFYTLNSALRVYRQVTDRCWQIADRYTTLQQLNRGVYNHLAFRKAKVGRVIFG